MNFKLDMYQDAAWATIPMIGAGIKPGQITEKHLSEYNFKFLHLCEFDDPVYSLDTPVRFYSQENDGDPWTLLFQGLIVHADRNGTPSREGIEYLCESFWYAAGLFTLKLNGIPRVVYNARRDDSQHDPDRFEMTVGEILADLVSLVEDDLSDWLTSKMHIAAAWPGLTVSQALDMVPPKLSFDAQSLQAAIVSVLKWAPDAHLRIDRATGQFVVERRASSAVHNLRLLNGDYPDDPTFVSNVKIDPRLDLALPRVKLYFPNRTEHIECYIDHTLTAGTPDAYIGVPESVTALDDLRFQVAHHPIHQLIQLDYGGEYEISYPSGIITFREHPANFFIRYIAEESQATYDSGLGGTSYTTYGREVPVFERYMQDFPVLARKFYLFGPDPSLATWLLSIPFGQAFPDPLHWPALLGKTVTIAGKGSSTIAEIAIHNFAFSGGAINGVGIRLAAAIPDAEQGDMLDITTEDCTASITALADSLWKALRDVRWSGQIPALRWMPQLRIGDRINLLNTNDAALATFAEETCGLIFEPATEKTYISLGVSLWPDFENLLRIISEKLPPENFIQSGGGIGGGGGGGGMKVHKHDSSSSNDGGNELSPKRVTMGAGVTSEEDKIKVGLNGVTVSATEIVIGDLAGNYTRIRSGGIEIVYEGKKIAIGVVNSVLDVVIESISYLFTHNNTRKLSAKVK